MDWLSKLSTEDSYALVQSANCEMCQLVLPDFSQVLRASTGFNLGADNGVTLGLWVFTSNPPGPGDFAISAATAGRHWKFRKPIAGAAQ